MAEGSSGGATGSPKPAAWRSSLGGLGMPRISSMNSVASWADCSDSDEDFDFSMNFQTIENSKDSIQQHEPQSPQSPAAAKRSNASPPASPPRPAPISEEPAAKECTPDAEKRPTSAANKFDHSNVPRNVDFAKEFESSLASGQVEPTTVMLRNIPNRYNQRDLIEDIKDLGFEGCFDFLYIPVEARTMKNMGYGFVNFMNADRAIAFLEAMQTHRYQRYRYASKAATASWAHLQGLGPNLEHYERCVIKNARLRLRRPVVLANATHPLVAAPGFW